MKILKTLLAVILVCALGIIAVAGWQASISFSFTGTTYTYWNTNTPAKMLYIKACLVRHDAAVSTNQVTISRVDSGTNLFPWAATEATANFSNASFTPDGNGEWAIPFGNGLRISQTATNLMYVILDPEKPE